MLNFSIKTEEVMRYDTVGDWVSYDKIIVADLKNPEYEFAVALHEMVEAFLCYRHGITAEQVDEFDMAWTGDSEPGNDPSAPYHKEHLAATDVEIAVCKALGIDFDAYDDFLNNFTVKIKEH